MNPRMMTGDGAGDAAPTFEEIEGAIGTQLGTYTATDPET